MAKAKTKLSPVPTRIGFGWDSYAFKAGIPLLIGGVRLDYDKGLGGHSDGDVIAHAVADAVLGPVGLPDLGTLFPADDDRYRGANSVGLLEEVAERVRLAGWWVENVDVAVAAETPRLAPHIDAMIANLVAALAPTRQPMGAGISVAVRPKRAEGLGAIGRSEGIAVWAVALLSHG
jgi:2-C-methyl-D-erythritol 2,4-cyclodiphosphate synthase